MPERKDSSADHQSRQDKADQKVVDQKAFMARSSATADDRHRDQQLLNETRQNKASLDINRAIFDYDEEHKDG